MRLRLGQRELSAGAGPRLRAAQQIGRAYTELSREDLGGSQRYARAPRLGEADQRLREMRLSELRLRQASREAQLPDSLSYVWIDRTFRFLIDVPSWHRMEDKGG